MRPSVEDIALQGDAINTVTQLGIHKQTLRLKCECLPNHKLVVRISQSKVEFLEQNGRGQNRFL